MTGQSMTICRREGGWRFVIRTRGVVRVRGPACGSPIEAWATWLTFNGDEKQGRRPPLQQPAPLR